jgi:hypothetical protein
MSQAFHPKMVGYQIDTALNYPHAFEDTPPPELPAPSTPLPEDLLAQLEAFFRFTDSGYFLEKGNRYANKKELYEGLGKIYWRVSGIWNKELGEISEDEKCSLREKVTEAFGNCDEGYHNRINFICLGFSLPKNLSHLLYLVRREEVIFKAFYEIRKPRIDEIHAQNFFSALAREDGLGITAINESDTGSGGVTEDEARELLKNKFESIYRAPNLPFLLCGQLQSALNKMGYKGRNDTPKGYSTENINDFMGYINQIFEKEYEGFDLFVLDEDNDAVRDVNWSFLEKCFFEKLQKDGFVNPEFLLPTYTEGRTLADCARLFILTNNPDFYETAGRIIEQSIKSQQPNCFENLCHMLAQLKKDFPMFYETLEKQGHFTAFRADLIQRLNLILSNKTHQEAVSWMSQARFDFLSMLIDEGQIKTVITGLCQEKCNDIPVSHFILAANKNTVAFENILDFLTQHHSLIVEQNKEALVNVLVDKTLNLFFSTLKRSPRLTGKLLNFMQQNLSDVDLRQILTEVNQDGNAFMWAAESDSKALEHLLRFIDDNPSLLNEEDLRGMLRGARFALFSLIPSRSNSADLENYLKFLTKNQAKIGEDILKEILSQKNGEGNLLMVAAHKNPSSLKVLLNFIEQNLALLGKEFLRNILLDFSKEGNALMLALRYNPVSSTDILGFITKHHALIDDDTLHEMLARCGENGNALMIAAVSFDPASSLKALLNFIEQHLALLGKEFLRNTLLDFSEKGNALMLSLGHYNPVSSTDILGFITKHHELIDEDALRKMLAHCGEKGNALMIAAAGYYPALENLLNFLDQHPQIGVEALQQIFMQSNQNENALTLALNQHDSKFVDSILAFLTKHPTLISQALLKSMFVDSGSVLIKAAYQNPAAIEPLLQFLTQHREIMGKENLLTMLGEINQDDNVLTILAGARPQTLIPLHLSQLRLSQLNHLLAFLKENAKFLGEEAVSTLLTHASKGGNILMSVGNPEALVTLLNFLTQNPEIISPADLKKLLTQKDKKGHFLLMLTVVNTPLALKDLLAFFSTHYEKIGDELLKDMLLNVTEAYSYMYINVFIKAAETVGGLQLLLGFLTKHPTILSLADLENILITDADANPEYNILHIVIHNEDSLEKLLEFLTPYPELYKATFAKLVTCSQRHKGYALSAIFKKRLEKDLTNLHASEGVNTAKSLEENINSLSFLKNPADINVILALIIRKHETGDSVITFVVKHGSKEMLASLSSFLEKNKNIIPQEKLSDLISTCATEYDKSSENTEIHDGFFALTSKLICFNFKDPYFYDISGRASISINDPHFLNTLSFLKSHHPEFYQSFCNKNTGIINTVLKRSEQTLLNKINERFDSTKIKIEGDEQWFAELSIDVLEHVTDVSEIARAFAKKNFGIENFLELAHRCADSEKYEKIFNFILSNLDKFDQKIIFDIWRSINIQLVGGEKYEKILNLILQNLRKFDQKIIFDILRSINIQLVGGEKYEKIFNFILSNLDKFDQKIIFDIWRSTNIQLAGKVVDTSLFDDETSANDKEIIASCKTALHTKYQKNFLEFHSLTKKIKLPVESTKEARNEINTINKIMGRDAFCETFIQSVNNAYPHPIDAISALKKGLDTSTFLGEYFATHRGVGFGDTKSQARIKEAIITEKEKLKKQVDEIKTNNQLLEPLLKKWVGYDLTPLIKKYKESSNLVLEKLLLAFEEAYHKSGNDNERNNLVLAGQYIFLHSSGLYKTDYFKNSLSHQPEYILKIASNSDDLSVWQDKLEQGIKYLNFLKQAKDIRTWFHTEGNLTALQMFLHTFFTLSDSDQSKVAGLIKDKDNRGYNTLMLFSKYAPQQLPAILKALITKPNHFDDKTIMEALEIASPLRRLAKDVSKHMALGTFFLYSAFKVKDLYEKTELSTLIQNACKTALIARYKNNFKSFDKFDEYSVKLLEEAKMSRDEFCQLFIESVSIESAKDSNIDPGKQITRLRIGLDETTPLGKFFAKHHGIGYGDTKSQIAINDEISRLTPQVTGDAMPKLQR